MLVVPQSTVTISRAPSSTSASMASAVGAVALGHAVGNVDARVEAVRGEEALHERGRAGAVDVVVAEHGDGLACARSRRRAAPRPCPCRARVLGSGISALMVGSSATGTSSRPMPRAASTRPSSSGRPWRWLMAMAVLAAAASSRSRHTKPRAEAVTPRKAAPATSSAAMILRTAPMAPAPRLPPAMLCRTAEDRDIDSAACSTANVRASRTAPRGPRTGTGVDRRDRLS